jgi:hypothetical protein
MSAHGCMNFHCSCGCYFCNICCRCCPNCGKNHEARLLDSAEEPWYIKYEPNFYKKEEPIMVNTIYLPEDEKKRTEIINDLLKENERIRLEKDKKGNLIAVVENKKHENIHPVTGLPILHD